MSIIPHYVFYRRPQQWQVERYFTNFFDEAMRELSQLSDYADDRQMMYPYWMGQNLRDSNTLASAVGSVENTPEKFAVSVNVSQFRPEELKMCHLKFLRLTNASGGSILANVRLNGQTYLYLGTIKTRIKLITVTSLEEMKKVLVVLQNCDRRSFLSPSFLTSTRPFCTSKTIKVEHKGKGAVRTLPSAAFFNPLLLPDKFALCQHEAKVQLQCLFDNINVDLKSEECGFFLRPEIELFPIVRCQRWIDRFFFACYISRLGSKEMVEYNKMMRRRTRLGSWQVWWFSWKHRLLMNKSLSTKDVLSGVPRTVEVLSQHLRLNKLSDLVKKGMVSKEAAEAVHSRLIKLSSKQRELFRLTKDDVCYSDASDMEESTRVYLVTERREDGRLFLDFYVQCLMQYKKSQSCTVVEGGRKVNNKSARDIQLPKDYGYSIPRSVYVVMRLSQQLKPEKSKDLIITAFNYIVCP